LVKNIFKFHALVQKCHFGNFSIFPKWHWKAKLEAARFICRLNPIQAVCLHFEKKPNTNYFCDLFLLISAALLTVGFEVAYCGKLLTKLDKVFYLINL
jgi:hypothetical protein